LLDELGVEVHNRPVLDLLADHGARVDLATARARLPAALVDRRLATTPAAFRLHDALGSETHHFHEDAGLLHPRDFPRAIPTVLDRELDGFRRKPDNRRLRPATVKVVSGLPHIAGRRARLHPWPMSPPHLSSARNRPSTLSLHRYGEKARGGSTAEGGPFHGRGLRG